jgi:hypothetical protein
MARRRDATRRLSVEPCASGMLACPLGGVLYAAQPFGVHRLPVPRRRAGRGLLSHRRQLPA